MKQPALLPSLIALAIGTTMVLVSGCGSTTETSSSGGTGGAGTTTTTPSGGTGGAGGMTTTTTPDQCKPFCDHLAEISCNILQDCEKDCKNHLNAPADCVDEADALLACWEANANDFVCTQTQVIPPAVCQPQEAAFNTCVKGGGPDTSCICSAGGCSRSRARRPCTFTSSRPG